MVDTQRIFLRLEQRIQLASRLWLHGSAGIEKTIWAGQS